MDVITELVLLIESIKLLHSHARTKQGSPSDFCSGMLI